MGTRIAGLAVAAGALAAATVTCGTAVPVPLPDIALGSAVLLHVERGVALLAGYLAVLVVISKAWNGQLPTEFSAQGLKYSSEDARARATAGLEAMEDELTRARDERLVLLRRIEAIEREAYRGKGD